MTRLNHIEIDGKRFLWRDLLQLRREQKKAHARAQQSTLFELKEDCRPHSEPPAQAVIANLRCFPPKPNCVLTPVEDSLLPRA